LTVENTPRQGNELRWGPQVESFRHERLTGDFSHYEVLAAPHPLGPWTAAETVSAGDSEFWDAEAGQYVVEHLQTQVGETVYYSVVSVDEHSNKSGMTNITRHETQLSSVDDLEKVYVVPNPFIVDSGFAGGGEAQGRIGFYRMPAKATIRIYSYSGQLVETIEHDADQYSTAWLQVTRNNQLIASGLYLYVVETPDGKTMRGKFVVIR
jgi:hypothetical protein